MTALAELDRRFARGYAAVAVPAAVSVAVAPSSPVWAAVSAAVALAAVGYLLWRREQRIEWRAAQPTRPVLSLVSTGADSAQDSAREQRTAA